MLFGSSFQKYGIKMLGSISNQTKIFSKKLGWVRWLNGQKNGKNMLQKNKGCFQFFGLSHPDLKFCNINDFD